MFLSLTNVYQITTERKPMMVVNELKSHSKPMKVTRLSRFLHVSETLRQIVLFMFALDKFNVSLSL